MPTQSQIVGGQSYTPYTPAWYNAREQDTIHRAGVGGTAAGTGDAAYLNNLSPSLQGLYSAISGGRPTSSYATPGMVNYPSGGYTSRTGGTPGQVSETDLLGGETAGPMPSTATIAPVDFTAANSAAFATAKDQAAKTADASMTGLTAALQARGMGGAGYEAGEIGKTLSREANTIGEAGRAEAMHEADLKAEASKANLAAEVTQRGQDIGARESKASRDLAAREAAYGGRITERGQDIGAGEDAARLEAERNDAIYKGQIAMRDQDIHAGETAADLAQRTAALKSNQTLQLLQAILAGRGRPGGVPGYVY